MMEIRNVFCVGRNYAEHAAELGNAVPEEPLLFMKPTHAVVRLEGQTIELPADSGRIHYETELVVHIGREYEPGIAVDDLVDRFALGIDFTLRDVQDRLKAKGRPWLAAKGFRQSAPVGPFRPFPGTRRWEETPFSLLINGKEVQTGMPKAMIFSLQQIVDHCGTVYGLGPGDLIFTGTPAGVGETFDGDRFELRWGGEPMGSFTVKRV